MGRFGKIRHEDRHKLYDRVAKGKRKSYSFNLIDLEGITKDAAEQNLVEHIDNIFDYILSCQPRKEVEEFTIGKSSTFQNLKPAYEFDRMDPRTWGLKGGVDGRWNSYYKKAKYNGLVALVAVDEYVIPDDESDRDVQKYALDLEGRLIKHYESDNKLTNLGHPEGRLADDPLAGVVYVAFKLRNKDEPTEDEKERDRLKKLMAEVSEEIVMPRIEQYCKDKMQDIVERLDEMAQKIERLTNELDSMKL